MGWTAKQWREARRQKGVPSKDNLPTVLPARVYQQGKELQDMMMMPALDWGKGLAVNTPSSPGPSSPRKVDTSKCACGCGFSHNSAVSGLEGDSSARRVLWFRTMRCKNKYFKVGA